MYNKAFNNGIVTKNMSEMIVIIDKDASIPIENIVNGYVHQALKWGYPHFMPMNFKLFTASDGR